MIINQAGLQTLFNAFSTAFNMGIGAAASHWKEVAMEVPSATRSETYAWLGAIPRIREWVGERQVKNLSLRGYIITNRLFEMTIEVGRTTIEDDQYGVLSPRFQQMGVEVSLHPDTLIFSLLASGFTTTCYDGQNFFDTDHPVGDNGGPNFASVSNLQPGTGPAWYLLDCSQPIKPLIYQKRMPFELQNLDLARDENVFWRDQYVYGVRGRSNVGFGLWQLAYASNAPLTSDNYALARAAMQSQISDSGRPLGVSPTHLVFPPSLERDARRLLVSSLTQQTVMTPGAGGTEVITSAAVTNEWAGSAKMVMTPFLLPGV